MNYDKQIPLTQEEIDYINSKDNMCIVGLPYYTYGYIYVEIAWDLPIRITRNEDSFWFNGESNKENYWVVYADSTSEIGFNFDIKQFKNIDKALEYGITEYKKWLIKRSEYVNALK
jgi:hypothetical protein